MGDSQGWRGPLPQSKHAQRAYDRKVAIDARIAEKQAEAKALCEAGEHTVVAGRCIVCKDPV